MTGRHGADSLPDIFAEHLGVMFCGMNPGMTEDEPGARWRFVIPKLMEIVDASIPIRTISVCGAPGYLRRHGTPQRSADLAQHHIIAATAAWSALEWRLGRDRNIVVRVDPAMVAPMTLPLRPQCRDLG